MHVRLCAGWFFLGGEGTRSVACFTSSVIGGDDG